MLFTCDGMFGGYQQTLFLLLHEQPESALILTFPSLTLYTPVCLCSQIASLLKCPCICCVYCTHNAILLCTQAVIADRDTAVQQLKEKCEQREVQVSLDITQCQTLSRLPMMS